MPEIILPPNARKLPDSKRHRHRFEIRSDSSDRKYVIAFDKAGCHWTCSCPSAVYRGKGVDCKHLRRLSGILPQTPEPEPPRRTNRKPPKEPAEVALPNVVWTPEQIAQAAEGFAE